jgi:hypothetical protein
MNNEDTLRQLREYLEEKLPGYGIKIADEMFRLAESLNACEGLQATLEHLQQSEKVWKPAFDALNEPKVEEKTLSDDEWAEKVNRECEAIRNGN